MLLLIDLGTGAPVGSLPDSTRISVTERLYAPDKWSAEVDDPYAFDPEWVGSRAVLIAGSLYVVDVIDIKGGVAELSGLDLSGIFRYRVVVPDAGQSHYSPPKQDAETTMKAYAEKYAGSGADWPVPLLDVATSQARGRDARWISRYGVLSDELAGLGAHAGIGWAVGYSLTTQRALFDTVHGADYSSSIILSRQNCTDVTYLRSSLGAASYVIVLGQGEGAARTRVDRWLGKDDGDPAPEGRDARVVVRDGRDTDDLDVLAARGDATLEEMSEQETWSFGGIQEDVASSLSLGDIVSCTEQGHTGRLRIVEREYALESGSPTYKMTLGRPIGYDINDRSTPVQ